MIRGDATQIIFRDVAFVRSGILGGQFAEYLNRFFILGFLGGKREGCSRRSLPDGRFLHRYGFCQRLLAGGVPITTVHKEENDDGGYRQRRRSVADNLGPVFFKKIDCVPDFERKLVGLQFFTGDSGHENLRLETLC